jgi:predicted phosphodiesterase
MVERRAKNQEYKTVIAIGDIHSENKFIDRVIPYIADISPDYLIIAGDLFDFSSISSYDCHKRNYIGLKELANDVEREIAWGNQKLDALDKAAPIAEKVFILGNHDIRYNKYATYEQAQFKDEDRLIQNRLRIKHRGWKCVDSGGYYKVGKLYFLHGEQINGDVFTKGAANRLRKNVRLWHHHTNQSYCITSPLNSRDQVEVKAIGCLCEKDPVYMRGITNRWINSFLVAHVLPDGTFQDYTINIIGNKFISLDGKLYN